MSLNFFKKKPLSPEKIARKMTEKMAAVSFDFFNNKDFKALIKFDELTQTEQDRIFNELVANIIALGVLSLSSLSERAKTKFSQNFYSETEIELCSCYGNWLRELGTPEEFAGLWKPLINLRVKEYQKDLKIYQKAFKDRSWIESWIHIVSIGCLRHIRRGKTKFDDELFIMLLKWFTSSTRIITDTIDSSI